MKAKCVRIVADGLDDTPLKEKIVILAIIDENNKMCNGEHFGYVVDFDYDDGCLYKLPFVASKIKCGKWFFDYGNSIDIRPDRTNIAEKNIAIGEIFTRWISDEDSVSSEDAYEYRISSVSDFSQL